MIKTLRRRFITIATLSIVVVVGIILGTLNFRNYRQINRYSDFLLEVLCKNDGKFPQKLPLDSDIHDAISSETPYEARYFTVYLNENNEVLYTNQTQIASISTEEIVQATNEAIKRGRDEGRYESFKYQLKTYENGHTMYVFLDCNRELATFYSFLKTSVILAVISTVVICFLVVLFSKIALRPAEESYYKQKNFITNASHDIKTPLAIINAETEVLELEIGETESTAEIKKQVARLVTLTEKLVFLSKMEEEQKIEFSEFCISDVFLETLNSYWRIAESKGFKFECECDKGVYYKGGDQYIMQAFALIMDNALKYTKPGGFIKASLKGGSKGIEIRFENQTEGIKAGNKNQIFERFYRLENSRNSKTGGQGIGLAVVKSIVLMHKGKINAISKTGETLEMVIHL